ncbi:LOW QUALITY PROTEIN: hypothetical protein SBY92_003787 [Candida maltosa Xu316]
MWIATVIFYILTLLLSLFGIQYHINIFKYPAYFTIPLTLAVFIPLSIIFLLPLDYVTHNSSNAIPWISLPDKVILYMWKSNYWITFLLTWLILPMLLEFYRSGHNTTLSKIKDALKENLKFQLIMLTIAVFNILYLMFEVGLSFNNLKLMVIAMSHLYSLILATWLMGHGLVSTSRNCWIQGSVIKELNHKYAKLPKLVDDLEDTKVSFREDVLQVLTLKQNYTSDALEDFEFRDWILKLYTLIPGHFREQVERQYSHHNANIQREEITNDFMTKLDSKFNMNLHRFVGYESSYNLLISSIIRLEDVINATGRGELTFRIDNHRVLVSPRFNFIYWYYMRPIGNKVASFFLWIVSFIILQSEFFHSTKMSLLNVVIYSTGIRWLQFFVSAATFGYMLFAAVSSLTQLKIFNMYHLVRRDSDPVSASWFAMYIARLTIPLSYNFLTLFVNRASIFEDWYGQSIHLTGLFNLLNNWIPRLILIPVLLNIFHIYDKLKKKIGFDDSWSSFDDDDLVTSTDIAKSIVNREMSRRNLQLREFNLTNRNSENLADLNYERNRREFHDSLTNRLDESEPDLESEPIFYNGSIVNNTTNGLWSKLNNTFGWIAGRNNNNNNNRPYRDEEPLENFNYDDDADENLIV